ncbi:hypothetical protein PXK30_05215 [Phaeobacter gallaeciensis]|uniref:hypothetical protein n=1 Tax=Phaeobacter gallaeciensis TaxID=60890 RepID=UPI00237EF95D|nr:hypothetical protein [Phaeobacter gallaeciensis]MDE4302869.1 hypothetical protein [Phaeobacter gallaeciensis]MDE4307038.1 hypothetical protein [Phaeobacter gallaeciensis]MDE4311503.1 hypothetical protein [Phaeobacter gallaeciensis]MDE4316190.1 hypothetical protein [Phaeobacter gallaeciensis]MDE4320430.1 hypothetical protein [Phaeobacter gallaeciensis]
MEQFLEEIAAYSAAVERSPQHILRQAIGANWRQWKAWQAGQSSPTLHTVDKIRQYMADNPVPVKAREAAT